MKNQALIIFLSLLTIGIISLIFTDETNKMHMGEIKLNSPEHSFIKNSHKTSFLIYETNYFNHQNGPQEKTNNSQSRYVSPNTNISGTSYNILGNNSYRPEKTNKNKYIGSIGGYNSNIGRKYTPVELSTMITNIPTIGTFDNRLYAESITEKGEMYEEEIIEKSNRRNVNIHDDPTWLNPWEKTPLGDALIPMFIFAFIWICILYFKNDLI